MSISVVRLCGGVRSPLLAGQRDAPRPARPAGAGRHSSGGGRHLHLRPRPRAQGRGRPRVSQQQERGQSTILYHLSFSLHVATSTHCTVPYTMFLNILFFCIRIFCCIFNPFLDQDGSIPYRKKLTSRIQIRIVTILQFFTILLVNI
jgi:hypothetical protein